MISTTWRDSTRGARLAHAVWTIAVSLLTVAALAANGNTAAAQADTAGQDIGFSDLYMQSGSGHLQGPYTGAFDLNTLLGADRFYNAGYTGTSAVMANIEAGRIWNGHETLSHVTYIPNNSASTEFDRHATWVGMIMGGRLGGPNPGEYQRGMAPNAQLASAAIATSWPTNDSNYPRYTTAFYLNLFGPSTFDPYQSAFVTGVPTNTGLRRADVINSSWVASNQFDALAGIDNLSGTLDAMIVQSPRTLLVWAAGNTVPTGLGPNKVPSAASAYNNLAVAALGPNGGAYNVPSFFTNGGPNNYHDPVNGTVQQVRQVVDIAAPGENFSAAYYGGQSGGNGPNVYGAANGPAGGPDWYSRNINGTSFATPTVSGGAALLYDAAYSALGSNADARDSRVMKAVLMNSADKTLGWDNGQTANPNGFGGVLTTRGVDDRVGAGRMNLNKAFDQLLSGTTDVPGLAQGAMGNVIPLGWDFGQVAQGATNDYLITSPLQAGSLFTATLTWFRDRTLLSGIGYSEASFDNLDLELWDAVGGIAQNLISASNSRFNNTEHFNFTVSTTGDYMLRVRWTEELFDNVADLNLEQYGLAWSTTAAVPEPGTLVLLMLAAAPITLRRNRP
jgi:hypothetical protein